MNNKYYTPELDDFYPGFEYETNVDEMWFLRKVPPYPLIAENIKDTRVKYLDKEDIENLDFKLTEVFENPYWPHHNYKHTGKIDEFKFNTYLRWSFKNDRVFILNNVHIAVDDISRAPDEDGIFKKKTLFKGTIKNKLELVRLFKQLNIK